MCVFGVKSGDLCGSEDAVAQGADWHSDAGGKYTYGLGAMTLTDFGGWLDE